ncbi:hypothetical protein [Arcobacter arenosus]|uniref:Uncharacterized protein n=1 Tax=Arcobacter arenosus TaxID=2576037 RepID=A0A5R8XY48_9BACT|nr:hypothetical protein [Arcobacter arenosus]TLP36219.1 hypothetical protein FDK22_13190 [Arcobacter arenosus]
MKTLFRYLKIAIVSGAISFALISITINFMDKRIKEELPNFMNASEDIKILTDTLSLCTGLMLSNPIKQNHETCKLISSKLEVKVEKLKEDNPYINFYTTYIKRQEF